MHIKKHFKKDFMIISAIFIALLAGILGFYLGFSSSAGLTRTSKHKNIIDHLSITVKNFDESIKFYDTTLDKLGYQRIMTFGKHAAGYGKNKKPSFWIVTRNNTEDLIGKACGLHIAFFASSAENVQAWHDSCLALGGSSNGLPGERKKYHPGYYAGYIIDPDGWHLEAVLHHHKST